MSSSVVSLQSSNPAKVHKELIKLKKKLGTANAVQKFVGEQKRFAFLLSLTTELINKAYVSPEQYNNAASEALSVLANLCHFSLDACFEVKSKNVLQALAHLLSKNDISVPLQATSVRLVANLCCHKESAAAVVQNGQILQSLFACVTSCDDCKTRTQSVRAIRLLSQLSSTFAKTLLRNEAAYTLGSLTCKLESEQDKMLMEGILIAIQALAAADTSLCGRQLARSGCAQLLAEQLTKDTDKNYMTFFLNLCRKSFDLRSVLVECGYLQKLQNSIENDILRKAPSIHLLTLFTQDAHSRVTMRTEGQLAFLVSAFSSTYPNTPTRLHISSAFKCFVYDQPGLAYLIEKTDLLFVIQTQLEQYVNSHSSQCTEADKSIYRPDSPAYLQLQQQVHKQDALDSMPLCKNLSQTFMSQGAESPGPSWSPAASSPMSSPAWSNSSMDFSFSHVSTDGGLSPATHSKHVSLDSWSNEAKDSEGQVVDDQLLLLSCLSHDEKMMKALLRQPLLEMLVHYVARVRNANPRAGRVLRRMVRNAQMLEELFSMRFALTIDLELRNGPCLERKDAACASCLRNRRFGDHLLADLESQADTPYGVGMLTHGWLNAQTDEQKMDNMGVVPLLIRAAKGRQKFLIEQGGLEFLIDQLTQKSLAAAQAVRAVADPKKLDTELQTQSSTVQESSNCLLNSQTISSNDVILYRFRQQTIRVSRQKLIASSEFYAGMFSGSYREAKATEFSFDFNDIDEKDFIFFLHFVSGCTNCPSTRVTSGDHCLILLQISDRFLCSSLMNWLIENHINLFLDNVSVDYFLPFALNTRGAEKLIQMCLAVMLRYCTASSLLNLVTAVEEAGVTVQFRKTVIQILKMHI